MGLLLFGPEGSPTCWFILAVIGILILIYVILYFYQRRMAEQKPVQHLCDYCGHMVSVVSDCHHARVKERFLHGVCLDCMKECRLVCARCKRPV